MPTTATTSTTWLTPQIRLELRPLGTLPGLSIRPAACCRAHLPVNSEHGSASKHGCINLWAGRNAGPNFLAGLLTTIQASPRDDLSVSDAGFFPDDGIGQAYSSLLSLGSQVMDAPEPSWTAEPEIPPSNWSGSPPASSILRRCTSRISRRMAASASR